MSRELNPNHRVTTALHEHWGTICAILVSKFGLPNDDGHLEALITPEDINAMNEGMGIVVQEKNDGIHLTLVDNATAHSIAKREGGLPT